MHCYDHCLARTPAHARALDFKCALLVAMGRLEEFMFGRLLLARFRRRQTSSRPLRFTPGLCLKAMAAFMFSVSRKIWGQTCAMPHESVPIPSRESLHKYTRSLS